MSCAWRIPGERARVQGGEGPDHQRCFLLRGVQRERDQAGTTELRPVGSPGRPSLCLAATAFGRCPDTCPWSSRGGPSRRSRPRSGAVSRFGVGHRLVSRAKSADFGTLPTCSRFSDASLSPRMRGEQCCAARAARRRGLSGARRGAERHAGQGSERWRRRESNPRPRTHRMNVYKLRLP